MRISSATVAGVAVGTLAPLCLTASASADPGNAAEAILLECDNGNTYSVTVAGNGAFTPAHDLESNAILVPTAFGEFHASVTSTTGTVRAEFTDPPTFKGRSSKPRATTTTCMFEFSETGFDEGFDQVVTFNGSGSVTGFVTPVG